MAKLKSIAIVCAVLCATAAHAQTLPSAKTFVSGLYAAYAHSGEPDYLGRLAPKVFAPKLLGLIKEDARTTPAGDVGALDGDPICNCQDSTNLKVASVTITPTGAGQATADVAFSVDGDKQRMKMDLAATPAGWRVADIHTSDTPSLVSLLDRELSQRHKHRR